MTDDSTRPPHRESLSRVLLALRDSLAARLDVIENDLAAERITAVQAREQAQAARRVYDQGVALASLSASTGWRCWRDRAGILYASHPNASPPIVVRGADPQALAEAIKEAQR
jgi:hypothetical protein